MFKNWLGETRISTINSENKSTLEQNCWTYPLIYSASVGGIIHTILLTSKLNKERLIHQALFNLFDFQHEKYTGHFSRCHFGGLSGPDRKRAQVRNRNFPEHFIVKIATKKYVSVFQLKVDGLKPKWTIQGELVRSKEIKLDCPKNQSPYDRLVWPNAIKFGLTVHLLATVLAQTASSLG